MWSCVVTYSSVLGVAIAKNRHASPKALRRTDMRATERQDDERIMSIRTFNSQFPLRRTGQKVK